ncbi:hypothetical protein [Kineosporia babensis]|uniref:Uncharacterized protein n=1 Tax=Kineosporia babensis TaxID=499548 RepID=A0A9X1NHA1_9ACTN|nr:hypothetical protein [Kineosporia babensis]MCD5314015.1 hypothetical protein [Kineosporia babensis]
MIDLEWAGSSLESDALAEMLQAAAQADAEAGFPQLSAHDPLPPGTTQLLIWLLPDERTELVEPSLAAYLRVEPVGEGVAELSYVVRPEYRSRGITTLALEKIGLGLDDPGGWQGTGARSLRIWAKASHPAALRMSLRFRQLGIRTGARRWQLVIPLKAGREIDPGASATMDVHSSAEPEGPLGRWPGAHKLLAADGALWWREDPGEPTEYGDAGRILAIEGAHQRELLVAVLERLRDGGRRAALITLDAYDPLVPEALALGFMHDQTDVLYTVGAR